MSIEMALVFQKDSNYERLVIGLYVNLSDALVSMQNPTYVEEIRVNYKHIEKFISDGGSFGEYAPIISPKIDRIKAVV